MPVTQLSPLATPGKRYSFSPKTETIITIDPIRRMVLVEVSAMRLREVSAMRMVEK